MGERILILDYGMGNLHSVKKKIERLGVNPVISSSSDEIVLADKIILPGVGHFTQAMDNLNQLGLIDALNKAVLEDGKPILGICLGMQLMAKHSEEGNVEGLGWFDANVVKFSVKNKLKYKIPHTGWNQIKFSKESRLMDGVDNLSEFYFVHAYHIELNNAEDELNKTIYEHEFSSAIEKNNIFGVQYHPEKSHDVGDVLLKNFIEL